MADFFGTHILRCACVRPAGMAEPPGCNGRMRFHRAFFCWCTTIFLDNRSKTLIFIK